MPQLRAAAAHPIPAACPAPAPSDPVALPIAAAHAAQFDQPAMMAISAPGRAASSPSPRSAVERSSILGLMPSLLSLDDRRHGVRIVSSLRREFGIGDATLLLGRKRRLPKSLA
jgi:hypothetical protein